MSAAAAADVVTEAAAAAAIEEAKVSVVAAAAAALILSLLLFLGPKYNDVGWPAQCKLWMREPGQEWAAAAAAPSTVESLPHSFSR